MAALSRGYVGRGNRGHKEEMAEMRRMIEELSRAVQTLQRRRERARAHWEVPKGNSEPVDIPEGSQEDEHGEDFKESLFHDACCAKMDIIALEDRLVDWETLPIYDEYGSDDGALVLEETLPIYDEYEDDGDMVLEDFEGISISEILPFPNRVNGECSQNLFDEQIDPNFHSLEELGCFTCESAKRFIEHSLKPLSSYVDPFLPESHMNYPSNKEVCYISSSTTSQTLESCNYEVKKNLIKELVGAADKLVCVDFKRQLNPEVERIILHGKIRGRIFFNKGSMMQGDPNTTYRVNWLYFDSLIPIELIAENCMLVMQELSSGSLSTAAFYLQPLGCSFYCSSLLLSYEVS